MDLTIVQLHGAQNGPVSVLVRVADRWDRFACPSTWIVLTHAPLVAQAWFNNFKIPFTSSVRVTIQSTDGKSYNGFYMIVRGGKSHGILVRAQS